MNKSVWLAAAFTLSLLTFQVSAQRGPPRPGRPPPPPHDPGPAPWPTPVIGPTWKRGESVNPRELENYRILLEQFRNDTESARATNGGEASEQYLDLIKQYRTGIEEYRSEWKRRVQGNEKEKDDPNAN